MSVKKQQKILHVYCDEQTVSEIVALAQRDNRSVSNYLAIVIRKYLDRERRR